MPQPENAKTEIKSLNDTSIKSSSCSQELSEKDKAQISISSSSITDQSSPDVTKSVVFQYDTNVSTNASKSDENACVSLEGLANKDSNKDHDSIDSSSKMITSCSYNTLQTAINASNNASASPKKKIKRSASPSRSGRSSPLPGGKFCFIMLRLMRYSLNVTYV